MKEQVEGYVAISLTPKQTQLLQPLLDVAGCNLGMLFGQFFEAKNGPGYFLVGFAHEHTAREMQKVLGVKVGALNPGLQEVYTDVE